MNSPKLYILPIELTDITVIDPLFAILAYTFKIGTDVYRKSIELDSTYNSQRNQYYSTDILAQIIKDPPPDAFRILGIVGVDIFIPVLTYLYGEAQLKGLGALTSTYRLYDEFYGKKANPELFRERLIKEAIHEVGHTYGLPHCTVPRCVMNSATYIDDVDEKSAGFCNSCASVIKANSP